MLIELKTYLRLHMERQVAEHFLCSTVHIPPQPRSAWFLFNLHPLPRHTLLQPRRKGTKILACLLEALRPRAWSITNTSLALRSSVCLLCFFVRIFIQSQPSVIWSGNSTKKQNSLWGILCSRGSALCCCCRSCTISPVPGRPLPPAAGREGSQALLPPPPPRSAPARVLLTVPALSSDQRDPKGSEYHSTDQKDYYYLSTMQKLLL